MRYVRTLLRVSTLLLLVALSLTQRSLAIENTDDIDTNRPSFMFSPLVVPKGSLQFENGTVYDHFQHGGTSVDLPETQVRLGLTKTTEFQMFVPNAVMFQPNSSTSFNGGASDLNEIGLKHQFPKFKKFQATFIGALNVPTGSRQISSGGTQPVFRIPWSYPLSSKWSIMGMQSLRVLNSGRDVIYEPDFMLTRDLDSRGRLTIFSEYGGYFAQNANGISIAHFGVVWKPARNHQLDMQWGFGMSKTAPAAFVGFGYSFRLDNLAWSEKTSP